MSNSLNTDYPYTDEDLAHREAILQEWESVLHNKKYEYRQDNKIKDTPEEVLKKVLLRPCKTKEELNNWIKGFLGVHLPDTCVDFQSNSNPLDMVWRLYQTAVWYDDLESDERVIRGLFYASRGAYKTFCSCIAELAIMLHTGRDTIHIGLIEKQAKNAYQKYFRPFLDIPIINKHIKKTSIMEQSVLKDNKGKDTTLNLIPCTMNATSGPRANLLVFDEIDKAKGEQIQAYNNSYGMRTATNDRKLPITFAISTRDSAFGLIQEEIDNAAERGTKVFHWNILDITERCPDSRSGTEPVLIYIRQESLYCISEEQYNKLPSSEKKYYKKEWGLDGCLKNCKIFGACKCMLKNQDSKCKWLKSIEDTQQAILSAPSEDMAIAQLLCRKPPTTGLVLSDFTKSRNVKTASQMYKIFTGLDDEDYVDPNMTVEDFIEKLEEFNIPLFLGVDAGYHFPCALLIAVDKSENIYVLKEYRPNNVDSPEFAQYLGQFWGKYNINMAFPDPESPDCASALRKNKFVVSSRVDKSIQPGIATLKGFIRLPGSDSGKLFVHPGCTQTIKECGQLYKYRQNPDGSFKDEPEKKNDHGVDALRYCIHSLFGRSKAKLWSDMLSQPKKEATKKKIIKEQISPDKVAQKAYGTNSSVLDNRDQYEIKGGKKIKKKSRNTKLDFTKF